MTATKQIFYTIVISATLVAALFCASMARAGAETDAEHNAQLICTELDKESTFNSMTAIALDMFSQGISTENAAEAMFLAGNVYCPEYLGLMADWSKTASEGQLTETRPVKR